MRRKTFSFYRWTLPLALLLTLMLSACNLSSSGESQQAELTLEATITPLPSRTPPSTSGAPTPLPLGTFSATQLTLVRPTNFAPTSVVILPPTSFQPAVPTNTSLPVSIVIISPVPGNVIAGNVQVLGAAVHPQFLQYQLEYAEDNGSNIWFPATGAVQTPVVNGVLGIWSTGGLRDGAYALRLRVYLRDGTTLATVVNNIRVQNQAPTPIPSPTPNIPRPVAAFTQDVTSGLVPLTVRFTNQSSGEITSYSWNFGDGSSSSQRDPAKTFNAPGLFNVTLTVAGPGGTANVTRQINVQSPTAPVAAFSLNPMRGTAPLTVQFIDQSTGTITSRLWNFSDGGASSERNPVHTFVSPGLYNVFLTVTGPGGSSTITRQIPVDSSVPATLQPTATQTPSETPSATALPILPSATFTATFLPTQTSSLIPTETASFTPFPTETATLAPTLTETPTFTPPPTNTAVPQPTALFDIQRFEADSFTVQFLNRSSGLIDTTFWDFGDGQTSFEPNPLHTYANPGAFTVTLTVTGPGGSNFVQAFVVIEAPMRASFTSAVQPNNPLAVQFTNTSIGNPVGFAWDFGDGQTSTEVNPMHVYGASGTYTVGLTAINASGGTNYFSQQVTVQAPVIAAFMTQVTGAQTIQFNNQSSGAVSYVWDFGDGTNSSEVSPSHTYSAPGTYTVTLFASAANGAQNTAQQQVTITQPLSVSFISSIIEGNPLARLFTPTVTGSVSAYNWDFGDGTTSSESNPQHTYPSSGMFTVTLTVIGADGSSANTTGSVFIEPVVVVEPTVEPTQEFTVNPGMAGSAPIIPDIRSLQDGLQQRFRDGIGLGAQASAFARLGDEIMLNDGYLEPFGNGAYQLGENGDLQSIIDWFNAAGSDGFNSFNRQVAGAGQGWRPVDLLDPGRADGALCDTGSGETPLGCELRRTQAGVALIQIGYHSVGTADPDTFRTNMRAIIDSVTNYGAIPVLFTIRPGQDAAQTAALNDVIVQLGADYRIPVINGWRALNELPNPALNAAPSGAGDLSVGATGSAGLNALNLVTLRTLDLLRALVFNG
jgi:PKD repeat protein